MSTRSEEEITEAAFTVAGLLEEVEELGGWSEAKTILEEEGYEEGLTEDFFKGMLRGLTWVLGGEFRED